MTPSQSTSSSSTDHMIQSRRGFISAMQSLQVQDRKQELEKCMTQVEPIQAQQEQQEASSTTSMYAEAADALLKGEAADRYLEAIRQALEDTEDCEITVAASEKIVAFTRAELAAHPEGRSEPGSIVSQLKSSNEDSGGALQDGEARESSPAPQDSNPEEPYVLLNFDPLLKRATSTLPPELQQLKFKLVMEATKIARARADAPTTLDYKDTQKHINETLRAHGEPDFAFDELTLAHDPLSPSGTTIVAESDLATVLWSLEMRRPKLYALIQDLLSVYIEKANEAEVQFKISPTNPPQADFQPTVPRRVLSAETEQVLMQIYEETVANPDAIPKSRAYAVPIHQLITAPTDALPPKLQQLKRHLLEMFDKLTEKYPARPEEEKITIKQILRSHGEGEFDFDDMFQYEAPESPTGTAVLMGKKALAFLTDLRERKPLLHKLIRELIQDHVTRGSKIPGYFRPCRRGDADASS